MRVKRFFLPIVCLAYLSSLFANDKNKLALEDIFDSEKYSETIVKDIIWYTDGSDFTYAKQYPNHDYEVIEHDVKSGKETVIVSSKSLDYNGQKIGLSKYSRVGNNQLLLVAGKKDKIWRHSWQAPHYLYDLKSHKLTPLANENPHLRNVKLSPDGRWVGYVRDFNIYIYDVINHEEQVVTKNGNGNLLNGEFDWVYEEEFGQADAWSWSPDGSKIVFWQTDQTRVKEFHLLDELPLYNEVFKLKYPKAGEQNAVVKIGVFDIESGDTKWMDIGDETDIYIPRIFWTNAKQLAILRLNRLQNHVELLLANTETGNSKTIIEDRNDTWIDVRQDVLFLKNHIVWPSERDGYKHACWYDYRGKLIRQVTSGAWEIDELIGVDETNRVLYFTGKKDSPVEQNVYRINLDGTNLNRISQRAGWHSGDFSPDFKYVVGAFSDTKTPAQYMIRKNNGELVRFLEKNALADLKNLDLPNVEFLTVKTTDNVELNAYMIKPANFDANKKYPVLVYGYGGPGSQTVENRWGKRTTLWHQFLAQEGYIVFCIDNRGTGGRGKAFKDLAYGDISKWAVHDQVEGAKYLQSLPYVDKDRLAFWGWSGGGYLTLMMLTRAADYFKTGIAVAPVSDLKLYDSIWTERYMGLPQENATGYKAANVLEYLDGLKGNLLLIHGTGDDNVHVQNTVQVIDELQKSAIQFDMMFYPNKNHSLSRGKTQLHLHTCMTNYLRRNL